MKRYTIRYTNKKKETVITAISTYMQLQELMDGDAKDSVIETKMSENMSPTMHNVIGKHNSKFEKQLTPPTT